MRDFVIGIAMTFVAVGSVILLFFGEWLFSLLPRVRQLKAVASRLSPLHIKPDGISDPLGEFAREQLQTVCASVPSEDRFREFGGAIDIVRLRTKSHQTFMKDVRKLSGALLFLFVFKIGQESYNRNFEIPSRKAVIEWIGKEPFSVLGALECMTLIFLLIRLLREHDELRELLD